MWLSSMVGYTAAGAMTAAGVGAVLGAGGATVDLGVSTAALAVLCVSVAALLRELGLQVPLLQLQRQTKRTWAARWSLPVAATLWGLDVGAVFTTWLTFAGPWVIAVAAFTGGSAGFGALLFLSYWAGRAASAWVAPALLDGPSSTPDLMLEIDRLFRPLRNVHALGLAAIAASCALFLLSIVSWQ